jgi:ribosomal protein L37E
MRILDILTDGGPTDRGSRHYECRRCGENLSPDADDCPDCGGDVAVYTF